MKKKNFQITKIYSYLQNKKRIGFKRIKSLVVLYTIALICAVLNPIVSEIYSTNTCGKNIGISNIVDFISEYGLLILTIFALPIIYLKIIAGISDFELSVDTKSFVLVPSVMLGVWIIALVDDLLVKKDDDNVFPLTIIRVFFTRLIGFLNFILFGNQLLKANKEKPLTQALMLTPKKSDLSRTSENLEHL